MTSEVIIYNKEALAMAADSAVTINSGNKLKTYNTANKLFMLSKFHPIGILIYNNSIINNIPVEILIKEYRKQLWKKSFNTIQDYCDDFQKFLNKFLNEQVKKENQFICDNMDEFKKMWEPVLRAFRDRYPTFADDVVDWYPIGQMEIVVKNSKGEKNVYNMINQTFGMLRTEQTLEDFLDEDEWVNRFKDKL